MVRGADGTVVSSSSPMVEASSLARTGPNAATPALAGLALVLLGIACLTLSEGERRAQLLRSLAPASR